MPVTLTEKEYFKGEAYYLSVPSPHAVNWGDRGVDSEIISPLHTEAGALAEATRQAAFLAGPLVEDVAVVSGARRDLMGKTITVICDKLGYDAGVPVFVIGFAEKDGYTELNILRSLA